MADNNGVVAGGSGEDAAIADMVFNVADDRTLGDRSEGQDVANYEGGLLAAVEELPSVKTFRGDEEFRLLLVAEGMAKCNLGKWSAATGIVNNVGDHSLQVAIAFSEIETAEPRRTLAVVGVGLENRPRTLTLGANYPSHSDSPVCVSAAQMEERWMGKLGFLAMLVIYSGRAVAT